MPRALNDYVFFFDFLRVFKNFFLPDGNIAVF